MSASSVRLFYEIWNDGGPIAVIRRTAVFCSYRTRSLKQLLRQRFYLKNKRKINANPKNLIYIGPSQIEHETRRKMGDALNNPSVIYDGQWDKAIKIFRSRYKVRSLIEHFENGVAWEDTEYYRRLKPRIEAGQKWRGCTSTDELRDYLMRYDELYETIRKEGYELSSDPVEFNSADGRPTATQELSEIGVNIGRNGELFWQSRGQHRLCIAQLLGLTEIPVQVITRHKQWHKVREEIRQCDSEKELGERAASHLHHPDLKELTAAMG